MSLRSLLSGLQVLACCSLLEAFPVSSVPVDGHQRECSSQNIDNLMSHTFGLSSSGPFGSLGLFLTPGGLP